MHKFPKQIRILSIPHFGSGYLESLPPPSHFFFYHYALNEHRKNKYDSQWKCTNEAFKAFFAPITDTQCGTCAVALVIWVSKGDFSEESGSELSESSWCCIILQTFFKLKICQRLWSALRHTQICLKIRNNPSTSSEQCTVSVCVCVSLWYDKGALKTCSPTTFVSWETTAVHIKEQAWPFNIILNPPTLLS